MIFEILENDSCVQSGFVSRLQVMIDSYLEFKFSKVYCKDKQCLVTDPTLSLLYYSNLSSFYVWYWFVSINIIIDIIVDIFSTWICGCDIE